MTIENSMLSTKIGRKLLLRDPFMVASSHWSDNANSLKALRPVTPSAITLKSISDEGGTGSSAGIEKRTRFELRNANGHLVGYFTDGPKPFELWKLVALYEFSGRVGSDLPGTKIGLSVIEGQDYETVAKTLELQRFAFAELNWKYSFRGQNDLSCYSSI
jgi:hypothetical protein